MNKLIKTLKVLSLMIVLSVCNIGSVFASSLNTNNNPPQTTVFDRNNNEWNSKYFRIPSMQTLPDGSMLAFSDIRYHGSSDHSFIDIGAARSTDGGKTWDYNTVMKNDRVSTKYSRVMDSTTVVTDTGRIILIAGSWNKDGNWASSTTSLRSDWSVQMVYSDDNGLTWSDKINLTTDNSRIKNQPSNTIGWLGGVGAGITMGDGTIVMPAQIALRENNSNQYYATIIYSKDNGETWTMGNKVPHSKTSENMVIELEGALIMSARNDANNYRSSYISHDLGTTWEVYEPLHGNISTGSGPGCQGSFIKLTAIDGHRIGLISAPKNTRGEYARDNITVYMIDFDDLSKGIKELGVPYPDNGNKINGGYSCLSFNNDKLNILYEADGSIVFKDLSDYYLKINHNAKNYITVKGSDYVKSMDILLNSGNNTLELVNRNNNPIHPQTGPSEYFKIELLNKNKELKSSIKMNGSDCSNDSKYDSFSGVKYEIGDIIKIYHKEPFLLSLNGQISGVSQIDNRHQLYTIKEDRLESKVNTIIENGIYKLVSSKDNSYFISGSYSGRYAALSNSKNEPLSKWQISYNSTKDAYEIKNATINKYLVNGPDNILYAKDDSKDDSKYWQIIKHGPDEFSFVNLKTNKAIENYLFGLHLKEYTGKQEQQFIFESNN